MCTHLVAYCIPSLVIIPVPLTQLGYMISRKQENRMNNVLVILYYLRVMTDKILEVGIEVVQGHSIVFVNVVRFVYWMMYFYLS